jgi:DNA-binding NtrC family response regulator
VTEQIVEALWPCFVEPVNVWRPGSSLVLSPAGHAGGLILQDVGSLARDAQRWLCDWLEVAGRTWVVSTTSQPLFPLLEAGRFCETLYYRLNVLCFDVADYGSRRG